MSIRKRLMLSNIAMIIIPVILFVIAAFLLFSLLMGNMKDIFHHGQQSISSEESKIFQKLMKDSSIFPNQLLDRQYLSSISHQLQKEDTDLIIRKGDNIVYTSKDIGDVKLPKFGSGEENSFPGWQNKLAASIRNYDFYFQDGSQGTIFFVENSEPFIKFARTFFPILFGSLLFILIFTNGLLTYFMSKSILKPVKRLSQAAEHISEGNLDFHIEPTGKDELGRLCDTFEEMRMRLKESTELREQYEENRKELLANISHDLKTPITTIKGYVEGIQDGVANTPEKMTKYLQTISSKTNAMDQLINELLVYSQLDLKNIPFHFEEMNLDEYLQDYLDERKFELEKNQVLINYGVEQLTTYQAIFDREKVKRVLDNLINNSLKYMEKQNKQIDVKVKENDNLLQVSIHDNGPGVRELDIPFIFDRFYRTDPSRNSLTGGNGLGLAIAQRIIEEHNGEIWAESVEGEGMSVFFTLPKSKSVGE